MEVRVRDSIVKSDVLIVGGGIGGMQAAITAAKNGADVVVAEKADTRRSGSGATGNDHFMCYIPEIHGDDYDVILQEVMETLVGPWQDLDLVALMMNRSFEVIKLWDSYGIDMKPTGTWNFEGHAMPGRRKYHLKYDGRNQKPLLTKQALKNGARIMNKTVVNELLTDGKGRVIGAIGINIADEDVAEVVIFQAKAVIVGTGHTVRMFPGQNPAYEFNTASCPADTGSGAAMAYRAGARLVNLDIPAVQAGPRLFARSGKATWIGVLTDYYGNPVGPFVQKPSREFCDATSDIWREVFSEKIADGSGPVFMNCSETSEEDMDYMLHDAFVAEGDTSITDYLEQYDIDLRKSMVEFASYEYVYLGRGVDVDIESMSTVKGLYAIGNSAGNVRGDITSAAVFGHIAGENACEYVKNVEETSIEGHPLINEKVDLYKQICSRDVGAYWKEANSTLQAIMKDYCGMNIRSETLMKSGIKYLDDLKRHSLNQLKAETSHELMRSLEVLDLIDYAKATALMSENRKESRGPHHKRSDYTYTNPLLNNKFQTIALVNGEPELEFRNRRKR